MGNSYSREQWDTDNDYELVIKTAKELEYLLEHALQATGNNLPDKINSVAEQDLVPPELIEKMQRLVVVRDRFIHDRKFHKIPEREKFVGEFEDAAHELEGILRKRTRKLSRRESCVIS